MAIDAADMITVEVAYALPQVQTMIALDVKNGTTAAEAIALSGILDSYPEIKKRIGNYKLGIFGKIVSGDTVLRAMDRVEIYRPLIANPKEARRQRAAQTGQKKPKG